MSIKNRSKPKKPKKPKPARQALPVPDDTLPPWLPVGDRWTSLPEAIRRAVPRVLAPAYRQFVLDAPDELQRSVGLTLVHLLWLEICDQARLTEVVADPSSLAAVLSNPEQMIDRHLNLVAAKSQTAELLVKLRLVTEALARPRLLECGDSSPLFLPPAKYPHNAAPQKESGDQSPHSKEPFRQIAPDTISVSPPGGEDDA